MCYDLGMNRKDLQREIEEAAYAYARGVESGERPIVGVNVHEEADEERVELHRVDAASERRQLERTARVRSERSPEAAAAAVDEVRRVAAGEGNLLVPMREALRARCTIGEVCGALRELWGTYDRPARRS